MHIRARAFGVGVHGLVVEAPLEWEPALDRARDRLVLESSR
jgi:hypothetical protein